jgi:arylsulfatase A-like enzyme
MADGGKPNIILVNCDDLGYGDLGCYGSDVHKTPYLDQLAAEGMRFTSHYVGSPVCSASRAALLTGCYPQRVGMPGVLFPGQEIGLNPDEETIASRLKQQGYATQIVGKWHCGDQPEFLPTRFGFDHYYGIPYSNDMGWQRNPDGRPNNWPPLPLLRDEGVIQQQPDQASLTERYMEESVRFIRANSEQPFFLYLPHMYVHLPIYVPQRFLADNPNPYAGAVACVDWVTGVIMQELSELGLDDNTLVIFTSDNGSRCDYGDSNSPLRGYKGTTWEGGQRVDCIMRWPAKIPAGTVCDEMTTAMDFLPTFDTIAGNGVPPAKPIDGKDISPLMFGETGATTPHDGFAYYRDFKLNAVRKGDWKLHFHASLSDGNRWKVEPADLLYNLADDVIEQHNLYEQHPETVAELTALAGQYRRELGDTHTGIEKGEGCREPGRVSDPKTLTVYNENYPYYMAEYDLAERG